MTWYRVCLAGVMGMALAACHDTKQGVLQPAEPVAYLRYVNVVPDTGPVDFRIIDIVGDAPSAGAATFRTGGYPSGIPTNFLPPHQQVQAGERQIRVFPSSTDPLVTSQYLLDTTVTFQAGVYYTFYLTGTARSGGVRALVSVDTLPQPAGVSFRVINLGGTGVGNVDVDIADRATLTPLAGTANFANVAPGTVTPYANRAVGATLKAIGTAPGTRGPFLFQALAPAGTVGTTASNPVAGTAVAGTAISAVIVPASVAGSTAPAGDALKTITSLTLSNDTATVATSAAHGLAVNAFINVYGADQAEYNGPAVVIAVDSTKGFKYRVAGTPVSPATGTIGWRSGTNDFTRPYVIFLIDKKPALTAP